MKKSLNLKALYISTVAAGVCLLSNNVWAEYCGDAPSAPSSCDSTKDLHYPGIVPPNHYGNARTDSFTCAITGSKQLTMDQINDRADMIPPSLDNRFYIRLGGNAAAEGVVSAKNVAVANNTTNLDVGTLVDKSFKVASNNFEIAFGYAWKDFSLDIEWLAVKSITFNSSMTDMTPNFSFSSTIKGDSILTNWNWVFKDMYNAKLYGIFSIGLSHNKSFNSIESGPSTVMNRYRPAGGIGLGARFNVISSLYADIAARALYLGKVRISATNGNLFLDVDGTRTWIGASFRLMWLI